MTRPARQHASLLHTDPPADGRAALLFDGRCALCRSQAGRLERLARGGARAEALQDALGRFPGLSEAEALREIKLVAPDGRVYGGAEAVVKLVALGHPLLGRLLHAYYVPGLRQLADGLYALIARNRYRLFGSVPPACDTGACTRHP